MNYLRVVKKRQEKKNNESRQQWGLNFLSALKNFLFLLLIILIIITILVFLISLIAQIKETNVTSWLPTFQTHISQRVRIFCSSIRVPSTLRTFLITACTDLWQLLALCINFVVITLSLTPLVGRRYPFGLAGVAQRPNFSKISSNSLDFFGWNLLKSWHFLYHEYFFVMTFYRNEKFFSDLQNFSTRNSPSVFPYFLGQT